MESTINARMTVYVSQITVETQFVYSLSGSNSWGAQTPRSYRLWHMLKYSYQMSCNELDQCTMTMTTYQKCLITFTTKLSVNVNILLTDPPLLPSIETILVCFICLYSVLCNRCIILYIDAISFYDHKTEMEAYLPSLRKWYPQVPSNLQQRMILHSVYRRHQEVLEVHCLEQAVGLAGS